MFVPAEHPKDRISLCMIVKDEAERLGRCLAAAAPWVGEIVVVDTGSTDETVAIATSHGAKVVRFAWVDDFAAARNASLEAATRPWALILDADEELQVDDPAAFAAAVTQAAYAGFSVTVRNATDDGREASAPAFRLFDRTRPGMRYRGEVHEQVAAVADRQARTALLPGVSIRHEGYLADVVAARGKGERNARLARKLVASRPGDPHAWYVLGLSLPPEAPGERGAAVARMFALLEADAAAAAEPYVAHAASLLVHDAGGDGDALAAFQALAAAGAATAAGLDALERWFAGLLDARRFDEVEAVLAAAPALGPGRWRPLRKRWAIALARGGFLEVALHLLLGAREDAPDDADLYYWIGACALGGDQADEARLMWEACLQLAPGHALAARDLAMLP